MLLDVVLLLQTDAQLAQTALSDAKNKELKNQNNQKCYDMMLKLADKAMANAEKNIKKPEMAIISYMNSWEFSQKAIEFAESYEDIC